MTILWLIAVTLKLLIVLHLLLVMHVCFSLLVNVIGVDMEFKQLSGWEGGGGGGGQGGLESLHFG